MMEDLHWRGDHNLMRRIALYFEPRFLDEAGPHSLSDWLRKDRLVLVTENVVINEDILLFSFEIHGNDLNPI